MICIAMDLPESCEKCPFMILDDARGNEDVEDGVIFCQYTHDEIGVWYIPEGRRNIEKDFDEPGRAYNCPLMEVVY